MDTDERQASECPPSISLTEWMKKPAGKKTRSKKETAIRDRLMEQIEKLIPEAIRQAKKGKPALLRLILRAIR